MMKTNKQKKEKRFDIRTFDLSASRLLFQG